MLLSKQLRALTLHTCHVYCHYSGSIANIHIITSPGIFKLIILYCWYSDTEKVRLSYKYQMLLFHKLLFILVEPLIGTSWKRTPHYKGHLSCPILILYYPSTKDTSIKRTMVSIIEGFHCIWIIKPRLYPNHYINHLPTHSYEIPCIIMY